MENIHVSSLLAQLRQEHDLTQREMSNFLHASYPTMSGWEKRGVNPERGGAAYLLLRAFIAILKQSVTTPDLFDQNLFREFSKAGAKQELHPYFEPFKKDLDGDFYEFIRDGDLMGVLFAVWYNSYLEEKGVQNTPGKLLMQSKDIPPSISEEELLSKLRNKK